VNFPCRRAGKQSNSRCDIHKKTRNRVMSSCEGWRLHWNGQVTLLGPT